MHERVLIVLAAGACMVLGPSVLLGQDRSRQQDPFRGDPLTWSVEAIMDRYVSEMTRHYNLSERQEKFTRELMTQRVKRFLGEYEKDVRWMSFEVLDYQMKGEMPPVEILREWGRRGQPMLTAIRGEIIEGNMRWREVLTPEQRQKHDADLEVLNSQFDMLEERLDRWSRGVVEEGDFPGRVSEGVRTVKVRKSEDAWTFYVRKFIQDYNLDEGQRRTAYSLLNELQRDARRYRESKAAEFAEIETKEAEFGAAGPQRNPEDLKKARAEFAKLRERRQELEKPISEGMFNRLKNGLENIPTADQRRAYEAHTARLAALAEERRQTVLRDVETRPAQTASAEGIETQPSP